LHLFATCGSLKGRLAANECGLGSPNYISDLSAIVDLALTRQVVNLGAFPRFLLLISILSRLEIAGC